MALCSLNTLTPRTPHKSSGSGELPVAKGARCIVTGLVSRLEGYVERPGAMSREHEHAMVRENVKNKYLAVGVHCTYHPGLEGGR